MTADFKTKKLPVESDEDLAKSIDDSYTVYVERYTIYNTILDLLQN